MAEIPIDFEFWANELTEEIESQIKQSRGENFILTSTFSETIKKLVRVELDLKEKELNQTTLTLQTSLWDPLDPDGFMQAWKSSFETKCMDKENSNSLLNRCLQESLDASLTELSEFAELVEKTTLEEEKPKPKSSFSIASFFRKKWLAGRDQNKKKAALLTKKSLLSFQKAMRNWFRRPVNPKKDKEKEKENFITIFKKHNLNTNYFLEQFGMLENINQITSFAIDEKITGSTKALKEKFIQQVTKQIQQKNPSKETTKIKTSLISYIKGKTLKEISQLNDTSSKFYKKFLTKLQSSSELHQEDEQKISLEEENKESALQVHNRNLLYIERKKFGAIRRVMQVPIREKLWQKPYLPPIILKQSSQSLPLPPLPPPPIPPEKDNWDGWDNKLSEKLDNLNKRLTTDHKLPQNQKNIDKKKPWKGMKFSDPPKANLNYTLNPPPKTGKEPKKQRRENINKRPQK